MSKYILVIATNSLEKTWEKTAIFTIFQPLRALFFNDLMRKKKTTRYFQLKAFIMIIKKKVILLGYLIKVIIKLLKMFC